MKIFCFTLALFVVGCTSEQPFALRGAPSQGSNPKVTPTVQLRISANGSPVQEAHSVTVQAGEVVQLKVEMVRPDGSVTDVTTDAKTNYFSTTPGLLTVGPAGRIAITSSIEALSGPTGRILSVGIIYGKPGDREIGATSVMFSVPTQSSTDRALVLSASKTVLGIGESAQLKLIRKLASGGTEDITLSPDVQYRTASESALILEAGAHVTCVGTHGQPEDSISITALYHNLSDTLTFDLRDTGPGPGLKIQIGNTTLAEGEQTKFSVRSVRGDRDLTSRRSGTTYVIFGGSGTPEPDLLTIDDAAGTITATKSLRGYNRRSPIVFARNDDLVGWIALKVTRASASSSHVKP